MKRLDYIQDYDDLMWIVRDEQDNWVCKTNTEEEARAIVEGKKKL